MMIDFEWDEAKRSANLAKHGVDFHAAIKVFDDPFAVDIEDRSMDYGEDRRKVTGYVKDVVLMVVYVSKSSTVRIISARRATKAERRDYENAF